jgi:methylated-DNA-[protein]-cysteine S-methyltransferase
MYIYLIETNAGWAAVAGSDSGICGLMFPNETPGASLGMAKSRWSDARLVDKDPSGVADAVARYFAGEGVRFECDLDYGCAGEFDVSVWNAARSIGYGEVRKYGWIADVIGKPGGARAVGQALGRNPIPLIVPCHRVIRSDGGLGGFALGLEWKDRLLRMERGCKV